MQYLRQMRQAVYGSRGTNPTKSLPEPIRCDLTNQNPIINAQVAAAVRQMALDTFVSESARIKERVKELKQMSRGANWLYQSQSNFQKACPQQLLSALQELQAGKEESSVFERLIENNASDKQLQDVEQLEGSWSTGRGA